MPRPRRWWLRRAVLALIPLALFLCTPTTYTISFTGTVRGNRPYSVWEFVMDFNNAILLNPTIVEFWLLADHGGTKSEWQYRVGYTEFLHQLPFIKNQAVADFHCIATDKDNYIIQSRHRTCFFTNYTCVNSVSEFAFEVDKHNPKNTFCMETVHYECIRILSSFCYNEVMFQRRAIFQNLDKYLSVE